MSLEYGLRQEIETFDDGSMVISNNRYIGGKKQPGVVTYYEIPVKVYNEAEELREYTAWIEFRKSNPDVRNVAFRVMQSNKSKKGGFYYVVKCFTRIHCGSII